MSAFGPKQTWAIAPHMSAFGGKADMALYGNPLSRSLLGVKRTSHRGPWTVPRACRSKTHYFIVTLASAIAAGIFGGGHGPGSTPTKVAFSEIGANLAKLCWRSSISAPVICFFLFFSFF